MIVCKCKACGGEMSIDGAGGLKCEYCGNKAHLSDKELEGYKVYRTQMLNFIRAAHDNEKTTDYVDALWNYAEHTSFKTSDGTNIDISYLYNVTEGPATMYMCRSSVLYHFPLTQKVAASHMLNGINSIEYPAADIKGLDRCFPQLIGNYTLSDGSTLIAFKRDENVFPLAIFGALNPKHVAWIISRMENICCTLEYSELVHGGFSVESIFINPKTHEAVLYGGWWNYSKKNPISPALNNDLADLRKVATRILGIYKSDSPKALIKFLEDKPAKDAFADFETWDKVIKDGFGGRSFTKMDIDTSLNF